MNVTIERYKVMDKSDVRRLLPVRVRDTHKGSYGKVLLLCGSTGFTGAACLAAKAAMRTGSGLVYLGVPEAIYPVVASGLEEPVVFPLPCDAQGRLSMAAAREILSRLPKMDAILMGCGMGQSAELTQLLSLVLEAAEVPVVLDADGINGLAAHKDVLRKRTVPLILTPHDGEFRRLCRATGESRYTETMKLARELNSMILRKGYRTLITDGITVYRNHTGNPGMAKGGSGDVLSGILVSLLGQGVEPLQAAALAAWIHGAAGDQAAGEMGEYGMLPSDLLERIPLILK